MAKRGRKASGFDRFADDLGSILGSAQSKAESWLGQRENIARQLTQIRDEASNLLSKLSGNVADIASAIVTRKPGRPAGSTNKAAPGAPRGRTVSAAARRKMSLAAKKRWAARKAAAASPPVVEAKVTKTTRRRAAQ
jgi:hypothetical protein